MRGIVSRELITRTGLWSIKCHLISTRAQLKGSSRLLRLEVLQDTSTATAEEGLHHDMSHGNPDSTWYSDPAIQTCSIEPK